MSGLDPADRGRLVAGLLRLYPAGWRDRYAEEFGAVLVAALADGGRRWRLAADVAAGAVDAHLHPCIRPRRRPMPDHIRRAASTAFCAFVAFAVAGSAFAKMTEDRAFTLAGRAHGLVGGSFLVVYLGAILAGLAVLAAGLPVLVSILRQALAGRRDLRRLLLVALAAEAAWVGLALVVTRVLQPGQASGHAAFVILVAAGISAQALSAGALVRAARRADLPPRLARLQWPAMTVLSLAMVAVSIAGLAWGLALRAQAPGLFHSDNGLIATALPATWTACVAVMLAATGLALAATVRALRLVRADRAASGT